MKKQYALVDTNNDIQDIMEVNDNEILYEPLPNTQWVEIKSLNKELIKDPEKFILDKNEACKKPEVKLSVSKLKANKNDTIDIIVELNGVENTELNIDGQIISVKDKDVLSIQLPDEGVYTIYSNNKKTYCPIVYIEVK